MCTCCNMCHLEHEVRERQRGGQKLRRVVALALHLRQPHQVRGAQGHQVAPLLGRQVEVRHDGGVPLCKVVAVVDRILRTGRRLCQPREFC